MAASDGPADKAQGTQLARLRAEMSETRDEMLVLTDKEILDEAEEARYEELRVQYEVVKEEHDKLEARAKLAEEIRSNKFAEIKGVPNVITRDEIGDVSKLEGRVAINHALRKLDERDNWLTKPQGDEVDRLVRRDPSMAKRVLLTESDAYRSAFHKVMTNPNGAALLTNDEQNAFRAFYEAERAAPAGQSLTSGDGGYAVPVFIDPSVILTDQESSNPFLSICRVVDINTSTWKGVSSAGVAWSFYAEEAEVSNDALTSITQPSVDAEMARGFIPFTIEISEDWPGFQAEMGRLLAIGYDDLLLDKFTEGAGSGSNEPLGILTACDASTGVEVVTTTDGQFGSEDLYAVWEDLAQKYRRNASWLMSVSVMDKIRQFGTYDNSHAYTVNLPVGAIDVLFARSVYEDTYMPDYSSTTGKANILICGDFSNYVIVRRRGMSMELVPHLFETSNNLPSGQRGWFAYARVGGGASNLAGFRLLQNQ